MIRCLLQKKWQMMEKGLTKPKIDDLLKKKNSVKKMKIGKIFFIYELRWTPSKSVHSLFLLFMYILHLTFQRERNMLSILDIFNFILKLFS